MLGLSRPGEVAGMGQRDIEGRVERLDRLSRGLALECVLIREGKDPLLRLERVAYLSALGDALDGVERARVALVHVLRRLRRAGGEAA
jgi:hypothetical protein